MRYADQHHLRLSTSGNKAIPPTLAQLEKGFARLEAPHLITTHNAQLSSQFLGRFGLKTAQDVLMFLKSPAGKSISGMMAAQLDDLEAIGDSARLIQQTTRLQHRRFIISLLLEIISEQAHANHLNREIQEDIDKRLEHKTTYSKTTEGESATVIDTQFLLYHESTEALTHAMAEALIDRESLENELALLSEERLEIESRYATLDASLSDVTFDRTVPNAELLQTKINDVELKMSSYTKILSTLLSEEKETEAHEVLQLTHTLHLKFDMLNRMKKAQQEERSFFNKQGTRVESFADADFMVPNDKTLTLEGNQYHLHPRSKAFSALSPAQKNEARDTYQHSKSDIMGIRMQVQLKRDQELSLLQDKKTSLSSKVDSLKQELELLTTLLSKIQAARVALQKNVPQENTHTPTPHPSPSLKIPELDFSHRHTLTQERRLLLEKLMNINRATTAQEALDNSLKLQAVQLPRSLRPSPVR